MNDREIVTFDQVVDEGAEVVGLLLLALTHLHHISQVRTHLLQHARTHLNLALEEPEQRILHFRKRVTNGSL